MYEQGLQICDLTHYRGHLLREERAASTIENYLRDVRAFTGWLNGKSVTRELAAARKEHLLAEGLASVTVNAKLSAVNSMFRFLGWEECRVKLLRLQRRAFREASEELTKEEYQRLIHAAQELGRERLGLLLETICATGIRVSEVRVVTVEAVRRGRADVALKGKVRTILLPQKLCRKLLKYAKKHGITAGEIFQTKSGAYLSRKQIWREMKSLCGTAGVEPSMVRTWDMRGKSWTSPGGGSVSRPFYLPLLCGDLWRSWRQQRRRPERGGGARAGGLSCDGRSAGRGNLRKLQENPGEGRGSFCGWITFTACPGKGRQRGMSVFASAWRR